MSIFVVAWHMLLFGQSLIFVPEEYESHIFLLNDFINFHLLLLAVPTFIYMSLILFASKTQTCSTLLTKVKDIMVLFIFWGLVIHIWQGGVSNLLKLIPASISDILNLVFTGGGTIYYFFTSLTIATVITFVVTKLSYKSQLIGLAVSVVFIILLPYFTILTNISEMSSYWNPLNFLPYCFASVLLVKNKEKLKINKYLFLILVVLSVGFSKLEWTFYTDKIFFPGQGYAFPAYTRISLLFSSSIFILLFLNIKVRSNAFITFMSDNSLGLFILHPFFLGFSKRLASILISKNQIIENSISLIITILLSYSVSVILRKYVFKKTIFK